jgi:hypothetical protein
MATVLDLLVEQGTTWAYPMELATETGSPIDLAGYTAKMHVRKRPDAPLLIELATPDRIVITPGQLELRLDPADTAGLKASRYVYDLLLLGPDESVTRILEGIFEIRRTVTHG